MIFEFLSILAFTTIACGDADPPGMPPSEPALPAYETLDPLAKAVRTSLVLRGVRPSPSELSQVESDPASLDRLVDAWLDSDAFGETIKDMHAEWLLVRADVIDPLAAMGPLAHRPLHELSGSPAEAPLELVRHVVTNDLPYTEIVTADYVLADDVVAEIYDLDYDPAGPRWQRTRWADGRPHAGLLSSTELWRRHESAGSNFNRLRANVVADTFLCESFADRDVVAVGGVTLSDEFAVANAVRTVDECVSCHQALDPLAAFFWGFKKQLRRSTVRNAYTTYGCDPVPWDDPLVPYAMADYCYPLRAYGPEDETWWEYWDLPAPAYFGKPGDDLSDLGQFIAEDPRFAQCMARRFYGWMTQSDPLDVPVSLATELQRAFVDSGFSAKELARAVVSTPAFGALTSARGATPEVPAAGLQVLRPEQLARAVEATTGFRWRVNPDFETCTGTVANGHHCWEVVDLMRSDRFGFRAMSGGINGGDITRPTHSPMPVRELVTETFAAEASGYVAKHDLTSPPGDRRLLRLVDATTVDEPTIRRQIAELGFTMFAEPSTVDHARVDDLYALWADRHARSDVESAWALVLTAMFLDPQWMFY